MKKKKKTSNWRTHVEDREFTQYCAELLIKRVLGKLDFSHVELTYAAYFEVFVNDL